MGISIEMRRISRVQAPVAQVAEFANHIVADQHWDDQAAVTVGASRESATKTITNLGSELLRRSGTGKEIRDSILTTPIPPSGKP